MLIRLVIIGVLLLVPAAGWAAIAVDTRELGTAQTGTTITSSFTINNASPVVFAVLIGGGQSVTAFTWNGVGADSITNKNSLGNGYNAHLIIVKNPATGTHNAVATLSSSQIARIMKIDTTGGDLTTGYRTIYQQNDSLAGPNTNAMTVVDSQNLDLVFYICTNHSTTIVGGAGVTTTTTLVNNIGGNTISGFLGTKAATGASTTLTTDVDKDQYAEIGVALMPSAGGGGATPHHLTLLGVGP
jgi:hypothetical protein